MNKQEKFQLKLIILTIIGMLISGFGSGGLIYWLTLDKYPEIYVGLNEVYPKEFLAIVDVHNKKDSIAMGLEGHYNINDFPKEKIFFEDTSLGKGQTKGEINFLKLENLSIESCKEEILGGIAQGSKGVLRTCRRTHNLRITDISCDTCEGGNIILTSVVKIINTEVECTHGEETRELDCELTNIF